MSDAREAVEATEALFRALLPTSDPALIGPSELQVVSFKYGRGTAAAKGTIVDIETHPAQTLNPGDVVVGVPIGLMKFYVVGKV
jgi:hypothetical protein